jgi:hypothetical protein
VKDRTRSGERGDAVVEAVLVTPVLLFLIMVVIQFGLWYHASHVAEAAAQEGASAGRVERATAGAARTRAQEFVSVAGPTLIDDVSVRATRDRDVVRVQVDGALHAVIPGLKLRVHGEAQSPVERFRVDSP